MLSTSFLHFALQSFWVLTPNAHRSDSGDSFTPPEKGNLAGDRVRLGIGFTVSTRNRAGLGNQVGTDFSLTTLPYEYFELKLLASIVQGLEVVL